VLLTFFFPPQATVKLWLGVRLLRTEAMLVVYGVGVGQILFRILKKCQVRDCDIFLHLARCGIRFFL